MTDAQLDALRDAAMAATPGPWKCRDNAVQAVALIDAFTYPGPLIGVMSMAPHSRQADDNARYIAAASPDVILALVDEVRRLRADAASRENQREAHGTLLERVGSYCRPA